MWNGKLFVAVTKEVFGRFEGLAGVVTEEFALRICVCMPYLFIRNKEITSVENGNR